MMWFKVYSEARNDAKLRSLSDAQHRTWFSLLCFASDQPERGTIRGYTIHHLAVEVSGGDTDLLISTCNALGALQSVTWRYTEDGTPEITFTKFAERQRRKPSDDQQSVSRRVAKHRKEKVSVNGVSCNAPVTPCNAEVTPPDIELELELSPQPAAGGRSAHACAREGTIPGPGPDYPPLTADPRPGPRSPAAACPSPSDPAFVEAIGAIRDALGDPEAERVGRERDAIGRLISGRWDCLAAAAREVGRRLSRSVGRGIERPVGLMVTIAGEYASGGIPAPVHPKRRDTGPPPPLDIFRAPTPEELAEQDRIAEEHVRAAMVQARARRKEATG